MENSAHINFSLSLLLAFAYFATISSCTVDDSTGIRTGKTFIADNVFKDSAGVFYLKVKNRPILHPSQWGKHFADSLFLDRVFLDTGYVELHKLVDWKTFKKVNDFGSYWIDTILLYVYRPLPVISPQFFALHRGKERFYGTKRDFMLYDTTLYYCGNVVKDVNTRKLSILRYQRKNGGGFNEFLSDGTSLFFSEYKLDKERLNSFSELKEEDKKKIAMRFSLE